MKIRQWFCNHDYRTINRFKSKNRLITLKKCIKCNKMIIERKYYPPEYKSNKDEFQNQRLRIDEASKRALEEEYDKSGSKEDITERFSDTDRE